MQRLIGRAKVQPRPGSSGTNLTASNVCSRIPRRRRFDHRQPLHAPLAFVAAARAAAPCVRRASGSGAAPSGTCVAPAVTTIASTAIVFAEVGAAVAVREPHVADLQRLQVAARLVDQRARCARPCRPSSRAARAPPSGSRSRCRSRARRRARGRCARARSSAPRPTAARSSARGRSAAARRRRRGSRAPRRRRCAAAWHSSPPARPRRGCPARAGARPSARACASDVMPMPLMPLPRPPGVLIARARHAAISDRAMSSRPRIWSRFVRSICSGVIDT